MPRYFFDLHINGKPHFDDVGMELPDFAAVRQAAMEALPSIAKEDIPEDGDAQSYRAHVRNEAGEGVYTASLTFHGVRLGKE